MDQHFVETDPFVEEFFCKIPYDSSDPEADWYKTVDNSEDDVSIKGLSSSQDDEPQDNKRRRLKNSHFTSKPAVVYVKESPNKSPKGFGRHPRQMPITQMNPFLGNSHSTRGNCSGLDSSLPNDSSDSHQTPMDHLNHTYPSCSNFTINAHKFSLSMDNTSFNNMSNNRSASENCDEIAPVYKGYQLIGDSQLVRFSKQVCSRRYSAGPSTGPVRGVGYCISGQKIGDLYERLKQGMFNLSEKVIMLIGTNDFTHNVPLYLMFQNYRSVVELLKEKGTKSIILLTVPPVPKLSKNPDHWIKLQQFNEFIIKLSEGRRIFTFDLAPSYISYNNSVTEKRFERYYSDGRYDLVHLNKEGIEHLKAILDIYMGHMFVT